MAKKPTMPGEKQADEYEISVSNFGGKMGRSRPEPDVDRTLKYVGLDYADFVIIENKLSESNHRLEQDLLELGYAKARAMGFGDKLEAAGLGKK